MEAVDELLNGSADIGCPSDIIGQGGEGEFCGDLLLPFAEELSPVVVVLDGAKGMFADLKVKLLFGDVAPYEYHDALLVALPHAPEQRWQSPEYR